MKRNALLLVLLFTVGLLGSILPVNVPAAQAGTVVEKRPGDPGYQPCSCVCVTVLGKRYCFCICDGE